MVHPVHHWLIPHHTNNFRPKLLHNIGLASLVALLSLFTITVRWLDGSKGNILGFSSTISVEEVVSMTNQERVSLGLPTLTISQALSRAAAAKAADMYAGNYWSHNSPSGKTPWDFVIGAGYDYSYAGENLAKDFSNTPTMIKAWMDSPTHKANIVSDRYTDIGVAVVPGSLNGKDTVLVVQMFGTLSSAKGQLPPEGTKPTPQFVREPQTAVPEVAGTKEPEKPSIMVIQPTPSPVLNLYTLKKGVSVSVAVLLVLVLLADLCIAESKKLSRRVGKNWAHLIFLSFVLVLLTVAHSGNIL